MRRGDFLLCECAETYKTEVFFPPCEDNHECFSMHHCPIYWWDWPSELHIRTRTPLPIKRSVLPFWKIALFHCLNCYNVIVINLYDLIWITVFGWICFWLNDFFFSFFLFFTLAIPIMPTITLKMAAIRIGEDFLRFHHALNSLSW